LEVLSISVAPLSLGVLHTAAGREIDLDRAITSLRAARLVRLAGTRDRNLVEVYHDRIRETVAASLDEKTRQQRHRSLAVALESSEHQDSESLAVHFAAAGEREKAAHYSFCAAERAASELSFLRAAALYRLALEQRASLPRSEAELWQRVGDCLVQAGRVESGTEAYETAARARGDANNKS
jgi:hypothetical protein